MVDHDPTQEQKKTDPGFLILELTCFRSLAKQVLVFWGTYFPGGGALGYFLGGYVPPGTSNWHPVLKKISPKIDTPL